MSSRIITLRRRYDDREGPSFDVTGWSPRELERLWDGLVCKIDFEVWCPHYTPKRGDDESLAEWVAS